jgi:alanyl-tRNA synthetase
VGDEGLIKGAKGALFRVADTQRKLGDLLVHIGRVEKGAFKPGDAVELVVDHARRTPRAPTIRPPTFCTRRCARCSETHVEQKGSLVAAGPAALRFPHSKPMSPEEAAAVEAMANAFVLQNSPVRNAADGARGCQGNGRAGAVRREIRRGGARRLHGAWADGGSHRQRARRAKANKAWSVELCGGTHVQRTGDIGLIRITAEAASAAGVRRIEALTAQGARDYLAQQDQRVRELAAALRTKPEDVVERVAALLEERKQMERELANAKRAAGPVGRQRRQRGGGEAGGPRCAPSAGSS